MSIPALYIPHPVEWQNRFNWDCIHITTYIPKVQTDMPDQIGWFEQGCEVCYA